MCVCVLHIHEVLLFHYDIINDEFLILRANKLTEGSAAFLSQSALK